MRVENIDFPPLISLHVYGGKLTNFHGIYNDRISINIRVVNSIR